MMIIMAAVIYMLTWIILHVSIDFITAAHTEITMIHFMVTDFMVAVMVTLPITQD